MRTIKKESTLRLERESQENLQQSDPFSEILDKDNIVRRSQIAMSKATTLSEAMPPLQLIAKRYNLKLHLKREYDRAVEILKKERS